MNYFFSDSELEFNRSLNAWDLLLQMGFTEASLYREGSTIRLFCPLHKDQIRRSLIVYTDRNEFRCQYTNCEGHKGGTLLEFYASYVGCDISETVERIGSQVKSESDLVERADKLIQEGSLVEALPLLQKAVQLDPTNEITRCRLAALYLELGDKEAGYKEYLSAAEHYGVRGELDKTLNIYNILIIISPDDVKVRKQLSYLFSRLGRQDEAVAQLKWVVDRHVRKGELADAAVICRKMIELCSEYPDSHRILGEILLKQGNYFDAVEELRAATANFIRENNLKKAKDTVDLGLRYTPGNLAMKEMRTMIEKALELAASIGDTTDEREAEFESWLHELKVSVGLADKSSAPPPPSSRPATEGAEPVKRREPAAAPVAPPRPVAAPLASIPEELTKEPGVSAIVPRIAPEDPRIEFCRKNLIDRTPEQLQSLYTHLVNMFNDVQRGTSEGILSEFEANVVREFYAAFCLAFDAYRHGLRNGVEAGLSSGF